MTLAIAYWCVLIAALLPYLWVAVAKASGERYDNRDPRGWLARQTSPRASRQCGAAQRVRGVRAVRGGRGAGAARRRRRRSHRPVAWRSSCPHRCTASSTWPAGAIRLRSLVWFVAFACVVVSWCVLAALHVCLKRHASAARPGQAGKSDFLQMARRGRVEPVSRALISSGLWQIKPKLGRGWRGCGFVAQKKKPRSCGLGFRVKPAMTYSCMA